MAEREFWVVNAFTTERFGGNPAAVLLDARGLDDESMQAIAGEFNLSETTFVLPPTDDDCTSRFRWFSPTTEVDMCGHATIAAIHAMDRERVAAGQTGDRWQPLHIQTKSGILHASVEPTPGDGSQSMIWLDLVPPTFQPVKVPQSLPAALGIDDASIDPAIPAVATQDGDLLLFVRDHPVLSMIQPEFGRLGDALRESGLRGLCVATVHTLTQAVRAQSRFFAPPCGIDEDPVTGSVHGPLAAHLVHCGIVPVHDGTAGLACLQGIPGGRTGLVFALVRPGDEGYTVRIGGQAVETRHGVLFL